MAIIRRAQLDGGVRDGISLNLGDLARQGDQIRDMAQAEAAAILKKAHAERERLIASAREEGLQKGLKEGHAKGLEQGRTEGHAAALAERKSKLEAIEKAWTQALGQFVAVRQDDLAAAREDVVRLAVYLAERIVRRAIAADPQAVVRQVESVLGLVARPTRLVVAINPGDEAVVREAMPSLLKRFPMAEHVELAMDEQLEAGGCLARTAGGGWLDATVETQLDRLAASIVSREEPGAEQEGAAA